MVSVVVSSGHGAKVSGAVGILNEVQEARKVCDRVGVILSSAGVPYKIYHENTATSVNQNLANIVNYHNSQSRDRDVSIHFNAYQSTSSPMGTECLYVSQADLAKKVSGALATAGGFINRGPKKRTDLYFLNNTAKPSILIEVCFVDSSADANLYWANFEAICHSIAETIAGVTLEGAPPTEPPVEPEEPGPEPEPPPEVTGENVVDVAITVTGQPQVVLNGEIIRDGDPANRAVMTLSYEGDVVVTVDGEDFQVKPPTPPSTVMRPTLRRGDQGPDVVTLQNALSIPADGMFGPQTEDAVCDFQTSQELDVDGICGPETWAALEDEYSLPPYQPPAKVLQTNIKASVFGGSSDPNDSAYPPYDTITDSEFSVALPWRFSGAMPRVKVINRANRKEAIANIRDIGPWLTDDCYWDLDKRPLAETCAAEGVPLPRGPNKGKIPNGAGIDVTPALANALGISGMGQVDWIFV
jgi:N-acetylmuramoyl-L-alanine amidase